MKGLNIKRIAAIGLGAALVGSALAPAVFAAGAVNNLSTAPLKKSDIVDATGTPVVDIIVGSIGQASDVVWAGNIAAKVAQMAVVPVGTATDKTVDITVGGTASVSGAGDTVESAMDFSAQEATFNGISVTDSKMPTLVNETSAELTWAGTDYTTTVKEVLKASANVDFQDSTSSSAYHPGELYASIAAGDLNYTVELGSPGIPLTANAYKNLDGNSDYDVKIPFLGKVYVLDSVTASSLVLYSSTLPTVLDKDQSVQVAAADGNKTYTLVLKNVTKTSSDATYRAAFALMDGTTQVGFKDNVVADTDLAEGFSGIKLDSVYVTSVSTSADGSILYVSVRTGSDRLELKDGEGYPYKSTDTSADNYNPWKVVLTGNPVTKITLQNQWSYAKTSGSLSSNSNSKYVLLSGEEVVLPNDFAKFKFAGPQTKATTEVLVGDVSGVENGGIQYVDLRGNTVKAPFYVQFDIDFNTPKMVEIQGKKYTFWIDNGAASYDLNVAYKEGDQTDAVVHTTWDNFDVNNGKVLATSTASLDLGAETATGTTVNTNYLFIADSNDSSAALVLKGNQVFNIQNKADSTARAKLVFRGTNVGAGAVSGAYIPNNEEVLNTILGGASNGLVGVYDSDRHLAADFNYTDNANDIASLYVETGDTGKAWDYVSLKASDNNNLGPSQDANTADWSLGTDVDSPLEVGMTEDGSVIDVSAAATSILVPDENRNAEVYLGSTGTSTTTTGGTPYTGVKVGETKGNVTVTAIAGATTGVTVKPVGNIVKLDTGYANGKSIIVGGHLVNNVAKTVQVNGQTLDQLLVAPGDYVAAVLQDGKVVVAGWTAADTGVAAQALISALDAL